MLSFGQLVTMTEAHGVPFWPLLYQLCKCEFGLPNHLPHDAPP